MDAGRSVVKIVAVPRPVVMVVEMKEVWNAQMTDIF